MSTVNPSPPAEDKSKELVQNVLKKNIVNIARKVSDGKTLSSFEAAQLQSVLDGGVTADVKPFVGNQVDLATALGCNRKTIQRWLKMPGCPGAQSNGNYCIADWKAFARKQGSEVGGEKKDKGELETERLTLINERLAFELAKAKDEYTENSMVENGVKEMVIAAKKVLLSIPAVAAPQVVGRSVADAEQILKEMINDALVQLHKGNWSTS